jgi:hypothetical protein
MMKNPLTLATTATALFLTACASPTVNLATPQPIKVDIAMRLDVYQHAKEASKKSTSSVATSTDPVEARRNRMADIQTFKNSRLVGEGRDALLAIRDACKAMRDRIDPADVVEKEGFPHVTVKYGLVTDDPDEARKVLRGGNTPPQSGY